MWERKVNASFGPASKPSSMKTSLAAFKKCGEIDAIIFSGDLTQGGTAAEFEQLDAFIEELLEKVDWLGARPKLLSVPGNHDLIRPDEMSPEAIALKQYWNDPKMRDAFWEPQGVPYRSFLDKAFSAYSTWRDRAVRSGWHLTPLISGLLPGDASYEVLTASANAAVVCLNSAWLQLGAANYHGQLHVDTRQLLAVATDDPDSWLSKRHVKLLVTHHPASWLHRNAPTTWENDVNPAGRFDAHLYGHMHEPDASSVTHGGQNSRVNLQAASLFGLERYGDEQFERIQGYSINRLGVGGNQRELVIWPRKLSKMTDLSWKIVRDVDQGLDEEAGTFTLKYSKGQLPIAVGEGQRPIRNALPVQLDPHSAFDLDRIRQDFGSSAAQRRLRRVEHESCLSGYAEGRVLWLTAEWGMGRDGFLAGVRDGLSIDRRNCFSIDFSAYESRDQFLGDLKERTGFSFQDHIDAVANAGRSILVLEGLDVTKQTVPGDVEDLARAVSDFADQTLVVINTRRRPSASNFPMIELIALDEADVAIYAHDSELGGENYGKADAASILFRHTDGVPVRLDAALRDLEIVSLKELINSNPDYGDISGLSIQVPESLVATVKELSETGGKGERRAYELLVALSALPQGERLSRLTRFLGAHPIGFDHARALMQRSLIETVRIPSPEGGTDVDEKVLVAPKLVREHVRDQMRANALRATDRRALELYFGAKWNSGDLKKSPTAKRVKNALCDGYEIQNASVVIHRVIRRAIESDADIEVGGVIRLASSFAASLFTGHHFRSTSALCSDLIELLKDLPQFDAQVAVLEYQNGRSLRMMGRTEEAQDQLLKADVSHLSKDQKQVLKLELALCADRLNDRERAVSAANEAIAIDRHSAPAIHARAILAGHIEDLDERERVLRGLLVTAEKKKSRIVANNIRIDIASIRTARGESSSEMLRDVLASQDRVRDFYNEARAIIRIIKARSSEEEVAPEDKRRLIEAYHYLYGERLMSMFDDCHDVLWNLFKHEGDDENLLNLFRRSSFVWRLSGSENKERKYLTALSSKVREMVRSRINQLSRDGAYLIVRVTAVLGLTSVQQAKSD